MGSTNTKARDEFYYNLLLVIIRDRPITFLADRYRQNRPRPIYQYRSITTSNNLDPNLNVGNELTFVIINRKEVIGTDLENRVEIKITNSTDFERRQI